MPDLILSEFAETLPDPDTAPSPWWTGPENDRPLLKRAVSIHQVRDNPMLIGRLARLEEGIALTARLAWYQPEGPVKKALEQVRWDLEEAWEMAKAERGRRPALWPPKPGDTWRELETGQVWKCAWNQHRSVALVATSWQPTNAYRTDGHDPESAWEYFGPFTFISGPAVAEHPFAQVVRELLEEVAALGARGGVYERELLKLGKSAVDDAHAHRRLVQVMGHAGADDEMCPGCEEEREDLDSWDVTTVVGDCPTLTTQ